MEVRQVLITGATGNLGSKLRRHLEGRYALRLLDIDPPGDRAVHQADLGCWDRGWVDQLEGVDGAVRLAADPTAHQSWTRLMGAYLGGTNHGPEAAGQGRVRRVVSVGSSHGRGGHEGE